MRKIVEYILVYDDSMMNMWDKVNTQIRTYGYEPIGGPMWDPNMKNFKQAMIKYEDNKNRPGTP